MFAWSSWCEGGDGEFLSMYLMKKEHDDDDRKRGEGRLGYKRKGSKREEGG